MLHTALAAVLAALLCAGTGARRPAYIDRKDAGNMSYVHVHDLSEFALGLVFPEELLVPVHAHSPRPHDHGNRISAANTSSTTPGPSSSSSTTPRPSSSSSSSASPSFNASKVPPDSLLGYEVECGRRGVAENQTNRIVGGTEALPGEFPWQVSLQVRRFWSAKHVCGGAVLSTFWVVTAGHCVDGRKADELSVVAGDHNLFQIEGHEERRQVVRIVGVGYDKMTFANDIALLQLDMPLKLDGKHIAPICVPKPESHFHQGSAIVSGWGRLSERGGLPRVLQYVSLPLLPWPQCRLKYKTAGFGSFLHTCQICSGLEQGGQDSCQGDSGGPLACRQEDGRYYLCGVVSWGIGCARAQFPGVYTEVSCYSRWIRKVLYNENHFLDPFE